MVGSQFHNNSTLVTLFLFLLLTFYHGFEGRAQQEGPILEITEVKVKVFPNPASSVVNILGLRNTAKANIIILDMYGNPVLQHRWEIRNNALNIPIPMLKSGLYSIQILSEEQSVNTKFYKR